jgi:hypothetical protein
MTLNAIIAEMYTSGIQRSGYIKEEEVYALIEIL